MKEVAEKTLGLVSDTLWPPICPSCRASLPHGRDPLCGICRDNLQWIVDRFCLRCGLPADAGEAANEPGWMCRPCRKRRLAYVFARSALRHEGVGRELVHRWKLSREELMGPVLGKLFVEFSDPRLEPWVKQGAWVVAIPMKPWSRMLRGFDPAAELARSWARANRLRSVVMLKRGRNRGKQLGRSAVERTQDWQGVFVVRRSWRERIVEKPVILVDDVMTTGSTVNAAAKVLKAAGCPDVAVITLAREV